MAKQLTPQEIADLIAGVGTRKSKDTSEPRTMDNWWNQRTHFIYRPDYDVEVKCTDPNCPDPRPDERMICLAEIKGTLMCRYSFLAGYLSDST